MTRVGLVSDPLISARAQGVIFERQIQAARRKRSTWLHAAWIVLVLTWGVAWPVCQWRAAQHHAITLIEPALVRLGETSGPLPEYMHLDAIPRLRHALEIHPSAVSAGQAVLYYMPMSVTGRDNEEVRVIALGLSPYLMDPKSPALLKPPYPMQRVSEGVPAVVRKEMARRGVRLGESLELVRLVSLEQGRLPNKFAASDLVVQKVITLSGSALSLAALVLGLLGAWRVRQMRVRRLALG